MAQVVRTYNNGNPYEEYFVMDGIRSSKEGIYKKYHYDGRQIFVICNYINDKINGEYKLYWENGQLSEICYYFNGKKDGEFKKYYKSGQLYEIYNYIDGLIEGEYKEYDEAGQLYKHLIYKNNKIIKRIKG